VRQISLDKLNVSLGGFDRPRKWDFWRGVAICFIVATTIRRAFAKQVMAACGVGDPRIEAAFAARKHRADCRN
jgi:hypothetical protein